MMSHRVHVFALRRGATLIELMVICLIISIAAVSLSVGLTELCTLEDEIQDKAFIRERLCRMISQYADCLSMSKTVSNDTINVTSAPLSIEYRTETGGVSFETNFVSKVISAKLSLVDLYNTVALSDNDATGVDLVIESEDKRYSGHPRHLTLDAASEIHQNFGSVQKKRYGNVGDVFSLKIEGAGSVRRLTLCAKYPCLRKINGARMPIDEVIEVSRVVRLWNYQ